MKESIFLIILLFSLAGSAEEAGIASYEDEMALHLAGSYPVGEVVWLDAVEKPFLALYREAEGGHTGRAAIILHSIGGHADWPDTIAPVRTGLPAKGWSTLSIQLPVFAPHIPFAEYGSMFNIARARIQSSLKYLQGMQYSDIVLIGYSFGASAAVNFLAGSTTPVRAFAGISMQKHAFLSPTYDLVDGLAGVKVPVLDIYGSQDFSDVVNSADDRRLAGSKSANPYEQIIIPGANHYYNGMDGDLVDRIAEWLGTHIPSGKPLNPETFYSL